MFLYVFTAHHFLTVIRGTGEGIMYGGSVWEEIVARHQDALRVMGERRQHIP